LVPETKVVTWLPSGFSGSKGSTPMSETTTFARPGKANGGTNRNEQPTIW
jgi:hypothetical protein